jgi:AcrR family transcriptional regulator
VTTKARKFGLDPGRQPSALPTLSGRARRDEILETAAAVFASSGYVGTSLKDLADACGIQPGSLYHHFDSKEAIVVELVERYQAELSRISRAALDLVVRDNAPSAYEQVIELSIALAQCSVRNRAALQLTFYEPPSGATDKLVAALRRRPAGVDTAMAAILKRADGEGIIKSEVDTALLGEQLCETMRHVGIGTLHRNADARQVASILCELVLKGGALPVSDDALDHSAARRAADGAIHAWSRRSAADPDGKAALILAAARTEFARRGYEATTVRDIAATAGIITSSVYRFVQSKEAMLESIMGSFQALLSDGYHAVMASDSTTVEKLDALTWLNISVVEERREEFAIQRAWRRTIPPAASDLNLPQLERVRQIRSLVSDGLRSGELHLAQSGPVVPAAVSSPKVDVLAMCYRDLMWPSTIVELAGRWRALALCRATFLRGATVDRGVVARPRKC